MPCAPNKERKYKYICFLGNVCGRRLCGGKFMDVFRPTGEQVLKRNFAFLKVAGGADGENCK